MRRSLPFLFLALALGNSPAWAAPTLPARVEGTVTWQGEADLPDGLLVAAGGTLVLERGARLRFGEGKSLAVEGTLLVKGGVKAGEPGAPGVRLASLGEKPWAGVVFLPDSTGEISGLAIAGAETGVRGEEARVSLLDSVVESCAKGASFSGAGDYLVRRTRVTGGEAGVEILQSLVRVIESSFTGCRYGLAVSSGAPLVIEANRITRSEIGILVNQSFSGRIARNLFEDTRVGVRFNQSGEGGVVVRNLFRGCAVAALQALSGASPAVLDNRFEKGGRGVEAVNFSSPVVERNHFSGFAQAVYLERRNQSLLVANLFSGNQAGVFINWSSYPLLRENAFENNDRHLAIGEMQSGAWEAGVGSGGAMRRKAGEMNSRNQALANEAAAFPSFIDARENWWDDPTRKEMEEKGEEGNIRGITDGRDGLSPEKENPEGAKYPRDVILFAPWLSARPSAGLLAWKGEEGELADDGMGVVAGRVVGEDGKPAAGALVGAWDRPDLAGEPVFLAAPSGADGLYSLRLPPGRYAMAARAGELFTVAGQIPVAVVRKENLRLGFVLLPWKPIARVQGGGAPGEGAVRGKTVLRGEGAEGVTVSLYLDAEDFFRGPAFLSAPSGKDGSFALEMVPPGRYFLVARRRGSGNQVGPMVKGDLFGYLRGNPLEVGAGESLTVELPLIEKKLDRDVNALGLPGEQPGFTGTVKGTDGKPKAGMHVFAYREPEMGHQMPAAVSSLTDASGRYTLYLPGPGRFYVGAREGFGDSPAPGEYFSFYQGNPAHSLDLAEGQFLSGIDFSVEKVLP